MFFLILCLILLFSVVATLLLVNSSSIKISEKGLKGKYMAIKQINVKWNDVKKISCYYNCCQYVWCGEDHLQIFSLFQIHI